MRVLVCGDRNWGEEDQQLDHNHPFNVQARLDRDIILSMLDGLWTEFTVGYLTVDLDGFTLIEGGAKGADSVAKWWAENSPMHGYDKITPLASDCPDGLPNYPDSPPFEHLHFPADWGQYGKAAGVIRNIDMLKYGEPDLVLAFHHNIYESKGTKDMVTRAREADVPVYVIG